MAAAVPLVDRIISTRRGRASQMNAGAAVCTGGVLLFLHADCTLPEQADLSILNGLASSRRRWGRFDVRLSGAATMLRVVERAMNLRSRLTGICTGDQGLFVERALFEQSGGFPAIVLMEDVAISATAPIRPAAVPFDPSGHVIPALGNQRDMAHHYFHVAAATGLFLRYRAPPSC